MNSDVLFCILNYNKDENAYAWYNILKDEFDTYILDNYVLDNCGGVFNSSLRFVDENRIFKDHNTYWGGQLNKVDEISRTKDYKWVFTVDTDVIFEEQEIKRFIKNFNKDIFDNEKIAMYFLSAKEGSSLFSTTEYSKRNGFMLNKHSGGLRQTLFNEPWFCGTRKEYYNYALDFPMAKVNTYGWYLHEVMMYYAYNNGKVVVTDDRSEILHPFSGRRTYSENLAEECGDRFIYSTPFRQGLKVNYTYKADIEGVHYEFPKDFDDAEKYVVLTCVRGENDYIKEFVDHYFDLGFDKIFLCDNNDVGDDSLKEELREYVESKKVEIFDFRGAGSFQVQFYSAFCEEGNYRWCAYFDADEFLELPAFYNVKDFCENIAEDAVCFNWLIFGSNGIKHKKEGRIQDRFKYPTTPVLYTKENFFVKSIVKGGFNRFRGCWFNGSHKPTASISDNTYNLGGYALTKSTIHTHCPIRYKRGYLKHYYTKSFDEWIKKSSRGWPDGTPTLKTSNFFQCESQPIPSYEHMINGLFDGITDIDERGRTMFGDVVDKYDIIQIVNKTENVYAFVLEAILMFYSTKNHYFIISDEHIDDATFNLLLEYAFMTGNRLTYAKNDYEVWAIYKKYNDGRNNTYYIMDLS